MANVKCLKEYLGAASNVPIIPVVSTISRGKWKVKNLAPDDYLLGYNSHLKNILANMEPSNQIAKYYKTIVEKLQPLSRPDEQIIKRHIEQIKHKK